MAVRRHVVAGLNIEREAFAEAFADVGHVQAEVTGPWTWFMASPWAVGADQLIERMARLPVTTLYMLTSDGCRWFLNLRGPEREPFSTCYGFYLATTKPDEVIREEAEFAEELRRMDAEWDAEMSAPRTGVVLLQGESVRVDEADVSSLKPAELRKLKSADRAFLALGFRVLGTVCTPETGRVIMRAYGLDSGVTYGAAYLNLNHLTGREYYTHFEEGGSLTTTTIDGIERIRRVGLFFRTSAAKDLRKLYEEHQTGIAKLKERGFTPKRAEPTLEAFAVAVADALHRRKLADL